METAKRNAPVWNKAPHGYEGRVEPWESVPEDTWKSPKTFTNNPPLFSELNGAKQYPLPVYFGMSEAAAKALIARSKDTSDTVLQNFLPGDKDIFTNMDACARWLAEKNRFPFMALDEGGAQRTKADSPDLAAFFWFTEEKPDETIIKNKESHFIDRFSVRVYRPFQGKGIAEILGGELLYWHAHVRRDIPVLLSVRADNIDALRVYKKLCFDTVGAMPDQPDGYARLCMRHNAEHFQNEYFRVGW